MQSITIEKNQAGQRFDKFLRKYLPNATTGLVYKMLRKKNITLNGKKAEGNEILEIGDEVKSFFSEETFSKLSGVTDCDIKNGRHVSSTVDLSTYMRSYMQLKGVQVLYEDEDILIVDKPAGILTQKAEEKDLSLNDWLIGYLLYHDSISEKDLRTFHPSVCNRLDRNTSGIVLCGKSLIGLQFLSEIIKDRNIRKFYRTVCVGKLEHDILLEGCLTKDSRLNKVMISKNGEKGCIKTALHPIKVSDAYTYLEVELFTGKTHQIRAHLAEIGHPIIGDSKYGNANENASLRKSFGLRFQLLHACRVEFPAKMPEAYAHRFSYLSGKEIVAPIPEQFGKILDSIRLL